MRLIVNGKGHEVSIGGDSVVVDGRSFRVRVQGEGPSRTAYVDDRPIRVEVQPGQSTPATITVDGRSYEVTLEGRPVVAPPPPTVAAAPSSFKTAVARPGALTAPIGGRVVRIHVAVGEQVVRGQVLLVLEAMKMENEVQAPKDGKVVEIAALAGARVNEGDVLIVIE